MTTIGTQIPESVLEQARALAAREGIPLEQIITLAVTQTIGVWSHESYVAHRAKRGSRDAFDAALREVPDAPAVPGDEWPK
jgi:hypothetical protein